MGGEMSRKRIRPNWSQSPGVSAAVVPGSTTNDSEARWMTSGLRPRCVIRHRPSVWSSWAWRRWTESLRGKRDRSMSGASIVADPRPTTVGRSACTPNATGRSAAQPASTAKDCVTGSRFVEPHSSHSSESDESSVPQRPSPQRRAESSDGKTMRQGLTQSSRSARLTTPNWARP